MENNINQFITYLHEISRTTSLISEGNLAFHIEPKSTEDTLGLAFSGMSSQLKFSLGINRETGISSIVSHLLSINSSQAEAALASNCDNDTTSGKANHPAGRFNDKDSRFHRTDVKGN